MVAVRPVLHCVCTFTQLYDLTVSLSATVTPNKHPTYMAREWLLAKRPSACILCGCVCGTVQRLNSIEFEQLFALMALKFARKICLKGNEPMTLRGSNSLSFVALLLKRFRNDRSNGVCASCFKSTRANCYRLLWHMRKRSKKIKRFSEYMFKNV